MLFRYKNPPKEGDYVLCTVNNIVNHSVFVTMEEYGNLSGMIHISEISPGRIRNIREFVVEGKKIICMVLRIRQDRNQFELSLRRAQVNKRRAKLEEIKNEETAEKIIEITAKQLSMDFKTLYSQISYRVLQSYPMINYLFNEVALENDARLSDFVQDKKIHDKLLENIKMRIKPEKVEIKRSVSIVSHEGNGAEIVRNAFIELFKKISSEKADIKYLGSGKYSISINAPDFQDGEAQYDLIKESLTESLRNKADVLFEAETKGQKTT